MGQSTARKLARKVVMLNFWATWCPPCRREMPCDAAAVRMIYRDRGLVVVAVNQWRIPIWSFSFRAV